MIGGASQAVKHAALSAALLLAGCSRVDLAGMVAQSWFEGFVSWAYKLVLTLPFLAVPGAVIAFLVMGGAAAAPLRAWLFPWRWAPIAAFIVLGYAVIWQRVAISEYRERQATQREQIATLQGAVNSYNEKLQEQNGAIASMERRATELQQHDAQRAVDAQTRELRRSLRANVPAGAPPHVELNAWLQEQE